VYLKTLTLKGFKSFADPTTIDLEPGVTVVVGPNGSGKSNVVDAVAWVLGAQGPSVVRSAKMDDVIFAGTQRRSALGRAEVSLTIDNGSRRLPIDFHEVTVTRTLFRTGESEYAINGAPCRLLDVQELLSDSGVGRQQHVIISQGQLDAVLTARPEDRRAIIEEAAGVLKYRRRRERAERRLESSEAGLARLQDLVKEVNRQIRPLERQAAAAIRRDELASELHGLRLFLARSELGDLHERLASGDRRRAELDAEMAITGADLARTWAALSIAQEPAVEESGPELESLAGLLAGTRLRAERAVALCGERRRTIAQLNALLVSSDQVAAIEVELESLAGELAASAADEAALVPEWAALERGEADLALREEELFAESDTDGTRDSSPADSSPADGAPGEGSPGGDDSDSSPLTLHEARRAASEARERLAKARERQARTGERAASVAARSIEQARLLEEHRSSVAELEREESVAVTEHELAASAEADASRRAHVAGEELRTAEEAVHAATARVEVLELALDEARARAGVERLAELPGVVGTLLDVVEVEDGLGSAFEAALEGVLEGVLVEGDAEAREALAHLRRDGFGGSVLPLLDAAVSIAPPVPIGPGRFGSPPPGTEPLRRGVRSADRHVERLLDVLLAGIVVCRSDADAALDAWMSAPEHVVVTPGGDRFSHAGWRLGAGRSGATRAALEASRTHAEQARRTTAALAAVAASLSTEHEAARTHAAVTTRALDGLRSELSRAKSATADLETSLERIGSEEVGVAAEHEAAVEECARATVELDRVERQLVGLEEAELVAAARRESAAQARREVESSARELQALRRSLTVRSETLAGRAASITSRIEALTTQLDSAREEQLRAGELRQRHERDDAALARLGEMASMALERIDQAVAQVERERSRRRAVTALRADRLVTLRSRREALERVIAALRDRRQRLEIELTETRVRHEAAVAALRRDLDLGPEDLGDEPVPGAVEQAAALDRLTAVEAELERIGLVNPLARDELAALEERSAFLEGQLDDVRSARRELGQVIASIDHEIVEVFSAAYEDVAVHFSALFTTLFPGGAGKLTLTAPEDPLTTGIEIDARPAGRNVRRLSLLSGGERSLVAMAFLFAVFRSRPSPFYLMDEVEAALDEMNLRRFLDLIEEFRDEAQLVIVSHQKRTMEIADALYGVTMQAGGSSKVVSEKIRGRASQATARTLEST